MSTHTHGNYAAFQRHLREDTPVCAACREANTAYRRKWREDPINRATEKARRNAERKAKARLAKMYPTSYRDLYEQHLTTELATARKAMQP